MSKEIIDPYLFNITNGIGLSYMMSLQEAAATKKDFSKSLKKQPDSLSETLCQRPLSLEIIFLSKFIILFDIPDEIGFFVTMPSYLG